MKIGETGKVPNFKYTQNAGRVHLANEANKPAIWWQTVARFIRENLVTYKCDKITIIAHAEIQPVLYY